jgi:hypothetical protein
MSGHRYPRCIFERANLKERLIAARAVAFSVIFCKPRDNAPDRFH